MNNLCIRTHNQVRKPQAPFCTGLHSFLSSSYTIFNPLFTAPTQLQWHGWPRPFSSSVQTLLALSTDRRIFNHAFLHFCYPVLLGKMVVRHPRAYPCLHSTDQSPVTFQAPRRTKYVPIGVLPSVKSCGLIVASESSIDNHPAYRLAASIH